MGRIKALTLRNIKETYREPLSLVFCIFLPLVMLIFMELILGNFEGGVATFEIDTYAPGIAVFGYTFTMLFVALGISSDSSHAFMTRILISPLKPLEYYLSYALAFLPICVVQTVIFYAVAFAFGFTASIGTLVSAVYLLPSAIFYIVCGMFIGTVAKSEKEAGPFSSIFITGAGLLGGVWMPIEQIGGTFFKVCKFLPFYSTIKPAISAVGRHYGDIVPYIFVTIGYTVLFLVISAVIYRNKAKK